jgi:phosphotransferase system  glucose/maltose/N-acetylglucosamine-specific IIC component
MSIVIITSHRPNNNTPDIFFFVWLLARGLYCFVCFLVFHFAVAHNTTKKQKQKKTKNKETNTKGVFLKQISEG